MSILEYDRGETTSLVLFVFGFIFSVALFLGGLVTISLVFFPKEPPSCKPHALVYDTEVRVVSGFFQGQTARVRRLGENEVEVVLRDGREVVTDCAVIEVVRGQE